MWAIKYEIKFTIKSNIKAIKDEIKFTIKLNMQAIKDESKKRGKDSQARLPPHCR